MFFPSFFQSPGDEYERPFSSRRPPSSSCWADPAELASQRLPPRRGSSRAVPSERACGAPLFYWDGRNLVPCERPAWTGPRVHQQEDPSSYLAPAPRQAPPRKAFPYPFAPEIPEQWGYVPPAQPAPRVVPQASRSANPRVSIPSSSASSATAAPPLRGARKTGESACETRLCNHALLHTHASVHPAIACFAGSCSSQLHAF